MPFKNIRLATRGSVSDFRTGDLGIYPQGVNITGRAVTRAEVQFWILLVSFFIYSWLIAALLLEFARQSASLSLRWDEIEQVAFVAKKSRACVVYRQTDKRGKTRRLSLATALSPTDYEAFDAAVAANAPDTVERTANARLRTPFASADGWSLLLGWIIVIAAVAIMGALSSR